jgi:hypothetical protein
MCYRSKQHSSSSIMISTSSALEWVEELQQLSELLTHMVKHVSSVNRWSATQQACVEDMCA